MLIRRTASGDRLAPLIAAGALFAAADTGFFPFGTVIDVPGYGRATVRDRGGSIKGPRRLDVFFPTESAAVQWGRRTLRCTVIGNTPPEDDR